MQRSIGGGQTLHRNNVIVGVHDRKRETGVDAPTIHDHRARSALTAAAAFLGAGERQMLSQGIEQREPRFDDNSCGLMVDAKRDADRRGQRFRTPRGRMRRQRIAALPRRGNAAASRLPLGLLPTAKAAPAQLIDFGIHADRTAWPQSRCTQRTVVPWSESADVQARPGRAALSPESDPERRSA